jgi:hypothetical protein
MPRIVAKLSGIFEIQNPHNARARGRPVSALCLRRSAVNHFTSTRWALEVGHIPEKDQETDRQQLLVLQGRCRHDLFSRLSTLLKCENERGQDGSLGRKGPRRIACPPGQLQVGKETVKVSRALRGRQSCGQRGR